MGWTAQVLPLVGNWPRDARRSSIPLSSDSSSGSLGISFCRYFQRFAAVLRHPTRPLVEPSDSGVDIAQAAGGEGQVDRQRGELSCMPNGSRGGGHAASERKIRARKGRTGPEDIPRLKSSVPY